MKKSFLLFAFLGFALLSKAQSTTTAAATADTYHAFKFDIGLGYAIPSGSGAKAGATFTLQPHYRLSDDLAIGLRIEGAGLGMKMKPAKRKSRSWNLIALPANITWLKMVSGLL